jgi:hypothetical protein
MTRDDADYDGDTDSVQVPIPSLACFSLAGGVHHL